MSDAGGAWFAGGSVCVRRQVKVGDLPSRHIQCRCGRDNDREASSPNRMNADVASALAHDDNELRWSPYRFESRQGRHTYGAIF